jgi:hypothetical protein
MAHDLWIAQRDVVNIDTAAALDNASCVLSSLAGHRFLIHNIRMKYQG